MNLISNLARAVVLMVAMAAALSAQTYSTEEQALKICLPKAEQTQAEMKSLTDAQRSALQQQTGLRFPEKEYKLFVGRNQGQVTGYAAVMNEIGKHETMTFMVGMSAQGEVGDVVMMVYRESRGGEVKEQRFMRQFHGKKLKDPLKVNQDIVNYTGATLSSQAIARGVKKALALEQLFYGAGK